MRLKNPFTGINDEAFIANNKVYQVKPEEKSKHLTLNFDTRKDARLYKKLLAGSRRKVESKIILIKFEDNMSEERVVT